MERVRSQIRYVEIFLLIFAIMAIDFVILPAFQNALPLNFWLPYDPHANRFYFVCTYIWHSWCGIVATTVSSSTNMYMFLVLIFLNFAFALLGCRLECMGYGNRLCINRSQSKSTVYADLIDLIKLQLKINE